jgi:hypothetical protein
MRCCASFNLRPLAALARAADHWTRCATAVFTLTALASALLAVSSQAQTAPEHQQVQIEGPAAHLATGPVVGPAVQVRLATGAITVDGKLNEPAWLDAQVMSLTQQAPNPGKLTPYGTEVRVLIYKDALIFGFRCHDPNPSMIGTHTLARDGNVSNDDTVSIVLDTFGDRRTGYIFVINALAARFDGLISGKGNYSSDWDGIWNARTARTEDGWTAEIEIPAQTLNFAGGTSRWGLELDRFIPRDQTELRWASPTRDADFTDLSRAGSMEMIDHLNQGKGIEIAPYANGKTLRSYNPADRNWLATGGGELTWRITPQLAAILTVNTDFAETEVDSRQINITPFPLVFPEKRAFFLEGANQYDFGLDLETSSNVAVFSPYVFTPFYSRNIGLLDGYNIPLDGGLKINGHVGPWSLALLDVQTRKTFVPQTVVDALGLPSAKVEGTNLLASRVAYDVDKHLRLGTVLTHGDPEAQLSNTLAGADAVWRTSTFLKKYTLQFGGWGATTQGQVPIGNREAWGLRFDYPNDLINCSAGTNNFNDGFEPLLGFLARPSTHEQDASCTYGPHTPDKKPPHWVRQYFFDFNFSRYTDTQGNLISRQYLINPIRFTTQAGDTLTTQVLVRHETLTAPFTIFPSVTYPVGSYDFLRYGLVLQTSSQRQFSFFNETYFGGYYTGHLWHNKNSLQWNPFHGKVEATVTADDYFAHSPQGNFVEKLWQFNGTVSLNPDLSLSTFVQYDNVSFGLSSNTRLRWTFKPGDDFFVIWDHTWVRDPNRPGINLSNDADGITAKIRWTFRL